MSQVSQVTKAVFDYQYLTHLSQQFAELAPHPHLTVPQFEQIMREQNQQLEAQLTDRQFAFLKNMQR